MEARSRDRPRQASGTQRADTPQRRQRSPRPPPPWGPHRSRPVCGPSRGTHGAEGCRLSASGCPAAVARRRPLARLPQAPRTTARAQETPQDTEAQRPSHARDAPPPRPAKPDGHARPNVRDGPKPKTAMLQDTRERRSKREERDGSRPPLQSRTPTRASRLVPRRPPWATGRGVGRVRAVCRCEA